MENDTVRVSRGTLMVKCGQLAVFSLIDEARNLIQQCTVTLYEPTSSFVIATLYRI